MKILPETFYLVYSQGPYNILGYSIKAQQFDKRVSAYV